MKRYKPFDRKNKPKKPKPWYATVQRFRTEQPGSVNSFEATQIYKKLSQDEVFVQQFETTGAPVRLWCTKTRASQCYLYRVFDLADRTEVEAAIHRARKVPAVFLEHYALTNFTDSATDRRKVALVSEAGYPYSELPRLGKPLPSFWAVLQALKKVAAAGLEYRNVHPNNVALDDWGAVRFLDFPNEAESAPADALVLLLDRWPYFQGPAEEPRLAFLYRMLLNRDSPESRTLERLCARYLLRDWSGFSAPYHSLVEEDFISEVGRWFYLWLQDVSDRVSACRLLENREDWRLRVFAAFVGSALELELGKATS
jgi:hypothetical protein